MLVKPKRVGLVVDSPKRDLQGLTLVAHHLLKLGHEPFLMPMYMHPYDLPLLGLDAVVFNYCRSNNMEIIRETKGLGITTLILDTEGGVLSQNGTDSPDNWARAAFDGRWSEFVDGYMFWGENLRRAFLERSGFTSEQLATTGCPRYDLGAQPWRDVLQFSSSDYVLVNANFSLINPLFSRSPEEEEKIMAGAWGEAYTRQLFSELVSIFPKYIETIVQLARSLPDQKFLLRPHPFESKNPYLEAFAGIPNVLVEERGDVMNVLNHCRLMLHLNCGTAIDTILVGGFPVGMEFLNRSFYQNHAPLPSQVSYSARTFEQLIEIIKNPIPFRREFDQTRVYEREIEPWFGPRDGRAAERVASFILDRIEKAPTTTERRRAHISASIRGTRLRPSPLQNWQGFASQILGTKLVSGLRSRGKTRALKSFSEHDVQSLLKEFHRVDRRATPAPLPKSSSARHPWSQMSLETVQIRSESSL